MTISSLRHSRYCEEEGASNARGDAKGAQYTLKAAKVEEEQVSTGKRVVNCLFAYCACLFASKAQNVSTFVERF
jgi:hypothetical protein